MQFAIKLCNHFSAALYHDFQYLGQITKGMQRGQGLLGFEGTIYHLLLSALSIWGTPGKVR